MCRLVFLLLFMDRVAVCVAAQSASDSKSRVATSACFEVESFANGPSSKSILSLCEELRVELFDAWGGEEPPATWEPRCRVCVHANRASYLGKVGVNGGQTNGSSLIQVVSGKVVRREIDLLINTDGELTALPHELTHVVLADRFGGRQPPHWLDEGIAMLADTASKQSLHHRDCYDAIRLGRCFPIREILALQTFSSPAQMPIFYGQSLSLVRMLAERGSPARLVDFAIESESRGVEAALKNAYAIDGIDGLELAWKQYSNVGQSNGRPFNIVTVSFKP